MRQNHGDKEHRPGIGWIIDRNEVLQYLRFSFQLSALTLTLNIRIESEIKSGSESRGTPSSAVVYHFSLTLEDNMMSL